MATPIKLMGAYELYNTVNTDSSKAYSVNKIATEIINDNDMVFAEEDGALYTYRAITYDYGVSADNVLIIKPDNEGGGFKRWKLMDIYADGLHTNSIAGIGGDIGVSSNVNITETLSASHITTPDLSSIVANLDTINTDVLNADTFNMNTGFIESMTVLTENVSASNVNNLIVSTANVTNLTVSTEVVATSTITNANISTLTNTVSGQEPINARHITTKNYVDTVVSAGIPVGTIVAWPNQTVPAGWVACEGASVLRSGPYANLFAAIGTRYGSADVSRFNIPNYVGYFLRGWGSIVSTVDPDKSSRTGLGPGISGDMVGTYQTDQYKSHTHTYATYTNLLVQSGSSTPCWYGSQSVASGASGGNETRSKNVYVMWIIKI